jgi:MSHA biogenesis protein MshM
MHAMRQDDWGADRLPFHAAGEPFLTTAFEEAAARLLFLAERRWPAGWLLGPCGCGKTALLKHVRRELRRSGGEVVFISLCGMDGDEFWPAVASALGGGEVEPGLAARKTVRALLVASSMIDRPVTFLFDDADRASRCLSDQLAAFVRMAESVTPAHSVVVATSGEIPAGDLARRIDIRAELRPFSAHETADYVAHRLKAAGCPTKFAPEAITELFTATAGVPAMIGRLADLALLAAQAAGAETVTVDLVRSAVAELRPSEDDLLVPMTAPRAARRSA